MSKLEGIEEYLRSTYTNDNYEMVLCETIGIPREDLQWLIKQAKENIKNKDRLYAIKTYVNSIDLEGECIE